MTTFKNISRLIRYYIAIIAPWLMKNHDFARIDLIARHKPLPEKPSEPEMLFINKLIKDNSTVIDIGSNLGIYLYLFKASGKYRRIIGFEPIPILFRRLKSYFPGLEIYDFAVSNHDGETKFKIPSIKGKVFDSRGTLHDYTEEGESKSDRIMVKTITLDSFADMYKLKDISFIKIDIEGHEQAAIQGAKRTIVEHQPLLMIEIEQRHHQDFPIQNIFAEVRLLGYSGYFYDPANNKFMSLDQFDVSRHQDVRKMAHYYINNFLFFSSSVYDLKGLLEKIEHELACYH